MEKTLAQELFESLMDTGHPVCSLILGSLIYHVVFIIVYSFYAMHIYLLSPGCFFWLSYETFVVYVI